MQACTEARKRGHFRFPTDFSPLCAFLPSTAHFKSVPKAFFVHCMTHWSLFPCYSCYGMGDGEIGADAHEQAPQLFPRTVEILAFLKNLFHVFFTKCVTKFSDGVNKGRGRISHLLEQIYCTFSPSYQLLDVKLAMIRKYISLWLLPFRKVTPGFEWSVCV